METKKALLSLFSLLLLASCIWEFENRFDPFMPQFIADISAVPTRAYNTQWELNDEVGVFMVNHKTTDIVEDASNRYYRVNNTSRGSLFPVKDTIYMPFNGNKVDFIAYYPFRVNTTLTTGYAVDLSGKDQQDRMPEFDLLHAVTSDGYNYSTASAAEIQFHFYHALTKLKLKVLLLPGVKLQDNLLKVFITGTETRCTFNLKTGTVEDVNTPDTLFLHEGAELLTTDADSSATVVEPEEEVEGDIDPFEPEAPEEVEDSNEAMIKQFEAIAVPQGASADKTIHFLWHDEEDGEAVVQYLTLPSGESDVWESGMCYEYIISLSPKKVLLLGNHSLDDWNKQNPVRVVTLTYDANNGTGEIRKKSRFTNIRYPLDSTPFEHPDAIEFLGWNTRADGSGEFYSVGDPFTCSDDTTLYAVWATEE